MHKFVEVCEEISAYDSEKGAPRRAWTLRNVYINPEFVVLMREDQDIEKQIGEGVNVAGLHQAARVTKIALSGAGNAKLWVTVIGSPEELVERFNERFKR